MEDRAAELLEDRQDLDCMLVFPRRRLQRALRGVPQPFELWRGTADLVRAMRARRYDAALDLQGNLKSGLVLRASGAGLRFGLGRPAAREGAHIFAQRRAVPPDCLHHRVERNLWMASAFLGEPLPYAPPGFPLSQAKRDAARRLLATVRTDAQPYAILQPGTSGFGAFKRWPPERFGALARRLAARGLLVLVTHGPGEEPLGQRVVRAADGSARPLRTPSLSLLAEVIRGAQLFVAADTGPLHLAALLGTPLLGLYGPKDPAVYGPYGTRPDGTPGVLPTLTQPDVACRPCSLRRCADPLCMNTLAPDRVFAQALRVMA